MDLNDSLLENETARVDTNMIIGHDGKELLIEELNEPDPLGDYKPTQEIKLVESLTTS